MLELSLRLGAHNVTVADSGARAIELAVEQRPEIALIDIGLPDIDGYEVARQIQAKLGDAVRLVALTGYGLPEDVQRAREAGFTAHLVKPAGPEALIRVLGSG